MALTDPQVALKAAVDIVSSVYPKRSVTAIADEYLHWLRINRD